MTRHRIRTFAPLGIALACSAGPASAGLVATAAQAKQFLGNNHAKLVYPANGGIAYVDFDESPLKEHQICAGDCGGPFQVSPDGSHVVYIDYDIIRMRPVKENSPKSEAVEVASKGDFWNDTHTCRSVGRPTWWIHPSTHALYVLVQTSLNEPEFTYSPGKSHVFAKRIDPATWTVVGSDSASDQGMMNGGRSMDGRFAANNDNSSDYGTMSVDKVPSNSDTGLSTQYGWDQGHSGYVLSDPGAVTMSIKAQVYLSGPPHSAQAGFCNGHINPVKDPSSPYYGTIFHLGANHHDIFIRKITEDAGPIVAGMDKVANQPLPWKVVWANDSGMVHLAAPSSDGYGYWEHCTWSWQANYGVSCAGPDHTGNMPATYLLSWDATKQREGQKLKLMDNGSCGESSLWMENSLSDGVTGAAPAPPARGTGASLRRLDGSAFAAPGGTVAVRAVDMRGREAAIAPGPVEGAYSLARPGVYSIRIEGRGWSRTERFTAWP